MKSRFSPRIVTAALGTAVSALTLPAVLFAGGGRASAEPLWQGTPFVVTRNLSGGCVPVEIPAGSILFAERAVENGVDRGRGATFARVKVTPLGQEFEQEIGIPVNKGPTYPGGDGYSGALELGIPVTAMSACGSDLDEVTIIGYLLPDP